MRRLAAIVLASTIGLSALAQPPIEFRMVQSDRNEKGGGGERTIRFENSGGGGERGGFGGRMMMGGGSPDEMFNRFSKGKHVIKRDELDPMMQMGFDMMARRMNITGNEITREQAKQFGEQMQSRMRDGGGMNPDMAARFTEEGFRRRDKNGDGLLDASEMSDGLKAERDKWDTNKDGFIDLNEYKAYASARFGDQRPQNTPGGETPVVTQSTIVPPIPMDPDGDGRRPTVFRFGYLPKELPEWFTRLDSDSDGQVSLYEWVKDSRTVEKFREMDGNDDDFVTAEEVLRFQNGGKILNYNVASAYNSDNREPAYRFNRDNGNGNFRGNGGGGRGPGGGDRNNNWMGGRGPGGNGNDSGNGRPNWMGGGGPGRGPGGNGGDRPGGGGPGRGPGGMEKGKGGMEKGGMGKGGRDRDRNNNGNGNGGRQP